MVLQWVCWLVDLPDVSQHGPVDWADVITNPIGIIATGVVHSCAQIVIILRLERLIELHGK